MHRMVCSMLAQMNTNACKLPIVYLKLFYSPKILLGRSGSSLQDLQSFGDRGWEEGCLYPLEFWDFKEILAFCALATEKLR